MTKKTRLIILLSCIGLFLIITPLIIFYSLGYRFDFDAKKIVATGGIYIKASPLGTDVIINSNTDKKTSIFSTYVFVQNLLPKQHTVLIKKDGYFDYQKTLSVKENEVTKLEKVTLFKKNLAFSASGGELKDQTQSPFDQIKAPEKYIIKNNNLYYSDSKENATLTALQKTTPIIKNIVAYKINGNITYLGTDGLLYSSTLYGENVETLSQTALPINKKSSYEILNLNKHTFIKENKNLLLLNPITKTFDNFASNITGVILSPDSQKVAYYSEREVLIYYFNTDKDSYTHEEKVSLNALPEKINTAYWLNDDYLLFELENSLMISEIDARNNINVITLPSMVTLSDGRVIETKNLKKLFNEQDKKLYVLNGEKILVSERLVP